MFTEEEEIRERVKKNLMYIMNTKKLNQKSLAKSLGISAANLNKVINGNQVPGVYPLLYNIRKVFNYSIDAFLCQDLEELDNNESKSIDTLSNTTILKYVALNQLYYFNTNSYKGRSRTTSGQSLRSGLVALAKGDGEELFALAIFDLSREKADDLYQSLKKCHTFDIVRETMSKSDKNGKARIYEGTMKYCTKHIFLDLTCEDHDHTLSIFHNPWSDNYETYLGGLGAVVSLSQTRNQSSPCIQCLGLSKESLGTSNEEIASYLLFKYPKLNMDESLDSLLKLIKDFYDDGDTYSHYNSEYKDMMIRYKLQDTINTFIENNTLRNITVSGEEDEDFYYYVKRARKNEEAKPHGIKPITKG